MVKIHKSYPVKKDNVCPFCGTKAKIGILLEEEHYFTDSKLIFVYTCDKCGKKWVVAK